ncbi:MAG: sugar ABC transporter permease [Treponema sp.]|nr:sugar ABC transporter permease [Treponema sp.]
MKKRRYGNFNQIKAPFLFLFPSMVIFLLFIIIPAFNGLRMSFMRWSVFEKPVFTGIENFARILKDQVFWITVRNTVTYSVLMVALLLVCSLTLAMLFHGRVIGGETIFRAVFYIPSLLSMITVGIAWRFIFGDEMGILNYLLRQAGKQPIGWLTDGRIAMRSVVFVSIWAYSGYYMVIFISGLQAIPEDLYEAARIDGASPVKIFFNITIPMLKSTTLVVLILATINAFKSYELVLVMTNGGPGYATKFIVQQVYQIAFMEDRLGYASAMSLVLMVIIAIFTAIQFKISGKEQDYE